MSTGNESDIDNRNLPITENNHPSENDMTELQQSNPEIENHTDMGVYADSSADEEEFQEHVCPICSLTFDSASRLLEHEESHKVKSAHRCTLCEKSFGSPESLRSHKKVHTKPKKLQETAKTELTKKHRLSLIVLRLSQILSGDKPFSCKECQRSYGRNAHLKRHIINKHCSEKELSCVENYVDSTTDADDPNTSEPFNASSQNPVSSSGLSREVLLPYLTGKRKIRKCEKCNKTFPSKYQLETHYRTHTGEKPYICTVCHKGFAQYGNLQTHKETHKKKRRKFKCLLCHKIFLTPSGLFYHKKQQSCHILPKRDPGPLFCDVCNATFTHVGHLMRHKKNKHNGDMSTMTENSVAAMFDKPDFEKRILPNGDEDEDEDEDDEEALPLEMCDVVINEGSDKSSSCSSPRQRPKQNGTFHECAYCPKTFSFMNHLEMHVRVHTRERRYTCLVCRQKFHFAKSMEKHKTVHKLWRRRHVCRLCQKRFQTLNSLLFHLKHHDGKAVHQCDHCNKSFTLYSQLKAHLATHTGEKPFSCPICQKAFSFKSTLVEHYRLHRVLQPNRHKNNGASENISPSENDPEAPKTIQDEIRSDQLHLEIPCDTLRDTFKTLVSSSPFKTYTFVCKFCCKRFESRFNLENHMRVHTGEKPYTCTICRKGFSQLGNLITHREIHKSMRKNFQCPSCPKTFLTASGLFYHKTRNSCEKVNNSADWSVQMGGRKNNNFYYVLPHFRARLNLKAPPLEEKVLEDFVKNVPTCDICFKAFAFESQLRRHYRIHTGEKPHGCKICGKSFNVSSNLKSHMTVHTRERFPCLRCSKSFCKKRLLGKHMRIHSALSSVSCDTCSLPFKNEWYLKDHKRKTKCGLSSVDAEKQNFVDALSLKENSRNRISKPSQPGSVMTRSTYQKGDRISTLDTSVEQIETTPDITSLTDDTRNESFEHFSLAILQHRRIRQKPKKTYECQICEKSFPSKSQLGMHSRIHTGERPFECTLCPRKFSQLGNLKSHMKTHAKKGNVTCKICDKKFYKRRRLLEHMQLHKIEEELADEKYRVQLRENEGKGISQLSNYDASPSSVRLQNNTQPFEDKDVAGGSLTVNGKPKDDTGRKGGVPFHGDMAAADDVPHQDPSAFLVMEMSVEEKEADSALPVAVTPIAQDGDPDFNYFGHRCEVCRLIFSSYYQLHVHMRVHVTNDKNFACIMCDEKFPDLENYNSHLKTHNRKTFSCQTCGKTFQRERRLIDHSRIHIEKKVPSAAAADNTKTVQCPENPLQNQVQNELQPDFQLESFVVSTDNILSNQSSSVGTVAN